AWKLLVSWVIACRRGLAGTHRGYVTKGSPAQDRLGQIDRRHPIGRRVEQAMLSRCMPRRQRSTVCSICEPSLSFDHALVKDAVALFGRRSSGNGSKHIRIGIVTPSPTAIASPLRRAGKKFIRPWEASGRALRTIS